jgi:hypothetical protein
MDRRLVAFEEESVGKITAWRRDFGDRTGSLTQQPLRRYAKAGHYVVALSIQGPAGQSRLSRVWGVTLRRLNATLLVERL